MRAIELQFSIASPAAETPPSHRRRAILSAHRAPIRIHIHMPSRTPHRSRYSRHLALLLALGGLAAGCGGGSGGGAPSVATQRDVARHFAEAIFRGRTSVAVGLLVEPHDRALTWLTRRAARPWRAAHASIRLPGRHAGRSWVFAYDGTRTHGDGSFEEVRGNIVIAVAAGSGRTGVESFALPHPAVRFGTHHDSVLLPSNR